MSYPILDIEGVGPQLAVKLKGVGVRTTATLLARAKDPKGRKALAAASGIEERRILKFANMADLMRIRGVANEYSELLAAAGVDTVRELKNRNAVNLTKALADLNAKSKLVRLVPSEKTVIKWIEQAKTMPPMMTY
jgi:predicted flap endonuclease-1-like 5' DNA nuclease